jgi:hypothetical protein
MKETKAPVKNHFYSTIVPTTTRLKAVHAVVEDTVDPVFANGLLAFDDISKRTETLSLNDESTTAVALEDAKVCSSTSLSIQSSRFPETKILNLCDQLNTVETDRAQLWNAFEQRVGDHSRSHPNYSRLLII